MALAPDYPPWGFFFLAPFCVAFLAFFSSFAFFCAGVLNLSFFSSLAFLL
jgi:hypothetical protein